MAKRRVKRTVARGVLAAAREARVRRTAGKVRAGKVQVEDVAADIKEEVERDGKRTK